MQVQIAALAARVAEDRAKLTALGPIAVLGRGYALALHHGKPVTSAEQARQAGTMDLRFADGTVRVTTEKERQHGRQEESNL